MLQDQNLSASGAAVARTPFLLELRQSEPEPDGRFTPEARISFGSDLASSGLLAELEPEVVALLLHVLAGVSANGDFIATPERLASQMGVSPLAALERLRQAAAVPWRGKPLLLESATESGLRLFRPSPAAIATVRAEPTQASPGGSVLLRPPRMRERIIARNRAAYARPRETVEAEIEAFYADEPPPQTEADRERIITKRRLLGLGITREQAALLLEQYPLGRISRQLDWLPWRHARNPAGYVLAAIEGNYGPPLGLQGLTGEMEDSLTAPAAPATFASPGAPTGESMDAPSAGDAAYGNQTGGQPERFAEAEVPDVPPLLNTDTQIGTVDNGTAVDSGSANGPAV